jgi:carbonic anhydrase/acetyltransferase-like protein (isoleucine patch superfamily)
VSREPGDWIARVRLHPSVFLAAGSRVIGDVQIGRGSSVWFNTVVRGDTARVQVGEETNLQDLTLVHVDEGEPAILGDRITVGHRAIIHGCRIEDDCLIGMGAIVLSGAVIGRGSLVGAGALVREGQEIPPGSLVLGAPARVLGPVKDTHRAAIARGASHYVALARSYAERGYGEPHPSDEGQR